MQALISDEFMFVYAVIVLAVLCSMIVILWYWKDLTWLWYVVLSLGQILFVWYFWELAKLDTSTTDQFPITMITSRPGLCLLWLGLIGKAYSRIRLHTIMNTHEH